MPNRLLLHERLAQAIAQAKRSGRRVGVLFIDLDRFKNVNDTLGHRIGDELLKHVTAALSAALRETDLLARLGGDEFMVIVEDFDEPAVLGRIAQKLLDAIAQPFKIEEHDIYVTSSIGIAVYPDDSRRSRGAAEARRRRDVPLEGARPQHLPVPRRRPGRAPAAPAHAGNARCAPRSRTTRCELHYQPVVRIADRAIVGAEALLRWNDPEHGNVPPQVFIPLAEESGLIHALGEWVLRSAAEQCVAWRKAGLPLTVSVNLSARQFYREDLAQRISRDRAGRRAASRRGSSSR